MPKATIEYNLDDSDDQMAHLRAIKSLDMALLLWEIAYNTKKKLEYEVGENKADGYKIIDMFYDGFWEGMNERGINLDELII